MSKYRPKILLVEDDILVAEFFNSFFKGKASLFHCSTGQSYFNYIKKYSIDLFYTDLHLPYTTGHKVIETIKFYDDSLPILVISNRRYPKFNKFFSGRCC
jgi:DNA-binding response OmpR family regulator